MHVETTYVRFMIAVSSEKGDGTRSGTVVRPATDDLCVE